MACEWRTDLTRAFDTAAAAAGQEHARAEKQELGDALARLRGGSPAPPSSPAVPDTGACTINQPLITMHD